MKIYCSGIGGIGLSAYAALQKSCGHEILGSDRSESELLNDLRSQDISVALNQDGTFLPEDLDLFVYSEAIPRDAPERLRAEELGVKSISYFQALGEFSRDYTVLAVCGTHGKSSTTAMAARVLIDSGIDPTIVVGTKLVELNGRNWRKGESDFFLLEACEYRRSFLNLSPNVVLLTNADGDHFDAFDSIEDYQKAFVDFLDLVPMDGAIYTHLSDPDCAKIASEVTRTPVHDVDIFPLPNLSVPGDHMRQNGQLVLGLAEHLGIEQESALISLKQYNGCWRRMELVGTTAADIPVIDDYAHHPREVQATIAAAREAHTGKRLVCVFQPHMHDRTIKLYKEFLQCFRGADLLLLTDVYDARSDVETDRVDMEKFVQDIRENSGVDARYSGDLSQTKSLLANEVLQKGDILLCMGAGDITSMARSFVADY